MNHWIPGNRGLPTLIGGLLAVLIGFSPANQPDPLSPLAVWTLGLGLGGTYLSIGVLVGLLPAPPSWVQRRWKTALFGAVVGFLYSLPGACFTMVPYPLAEDAAPYFREFVSGGARAFGFTLGFGAVVGALCGIGKARKNSPKPQG